MSTRALWSDDFEARASCATDVSGIRHVPAHLARPDSRDEVLEVLHKAAVERLSVTPAGAQTSTTGASVAPEDGLLLSTARLQGVLDIDPAARVARVEPGVVLGELNAALASEGLFFAPDPTSENEATVGGSIACNASGARTLLYGPTRGHVRALTVALADGSVLELRRPVIDKNTVGFAPVHDPVDWFVGSEGTLGVILEAELALLPLPEVVVGLGIPFPDQHAALAFVVEARESERLRPRCLEYFDATSFGFAREAHGGGAWAGVEGTMVYLEEAGFDEPDFEGWLELAEKHGADAEAIAVFDDESSLREARRIRHACPAAMHELTGPWLEAGGRRISTDWAVPHRRVDEALTRAAQVAEQHGIEPAVTYGHLGNGHPHQNWVAKNPGEVERVEAAVEEILRTVVLPMGGTVAAEHGIGKLKARWLPLQIDRRQLALMRALKHEFDPEGRMAPGNVLAG
jgi:FAD/FMN-containing dehydrogenase